MWEMWGNKIYNHDGLKNEGKIMELKEGGEVWKDIGIPYIVV